MNTQITTLRWSWVCKSGTFALILALILVLASCTGSERVKIQNEATLYTASLASQLTREVRMHGVDKTVASLPALLPTLWKKGDLDTSHEPTVAKPFTSVADYRADITKDNEFVRIRVTCIRPDIQTQGGGPVFEELTVPVKDLPENRPSRK